MPLFATSQEWLEQSALLLEARPSTTRITTTYTHSKPRRYRRRKLPLQSSTAPADGTTADATAATPQSATLTLKTHDPVSGVTLKYRTPKAAEVGRLIAACGRLGHGMARTKDRAFASVVDEGVAGVASTGSAGLTVAEAKAVDDEDAVMMDAEDGEAPARKTNERRKKSVSFAAEPPKLNTSGQAPTQGQGQGGGGGGKKKKKGKK